VVESVYSAVRTDSLYKADYVSSLKGSPVNCITAEQPAVIRFFVYGQKALQHLKFVEEF
jgi:hypothetical protein